MIALVATGIVCILFARIVDKTPKSILVPVCFGPRVLFGVAFNFITNPSSVMAYILAVGLTITTAVIFMSVESLFSDCNRGSSIISFPFHWGALDCLDYCPN